ncbi:MAG: hypothetical protein ACREIV_16955, partial [Planctomycetaceae bacterium]
MARFRLQQAGLWAVFAAALVMAVPAAAQEEPAAETPQADKTDPADTETEKDKEDAAKLAEELAKRFQVPEAGPAELLKFIEETKNTSIPPEYREREKRLAYVKAAYLAFRDAASKAFEAENVDAKTAAQAANEKLDALESLERLGDETAGEQREKFLARLREDQRPEVVSVVEMKELVERLRQLAGTEQEEREQ